MGKFIKSEFEKIGESHFLDSRNCYTPKNIPDMTFKAAIAAAKDITSWKKRSLSEQAGIGQIIANEVCRELGILPVTLSVGKSSFRGNPFGASSVFEARIFDKGLNDKTVVDTIAHEVFHSFQSQASSGRYGILPANPTELVLWYLSPPTPKPGLEYYNSFTEVSARIFGQEFAERHGCPSSRENFIGYHKIAVRKAKHALKRGSTKWGTEEDIKKAENIELLYRDSCKKPPHEFRGYSSLCAIGYARDLQKFTQNLIAMNPQAKISVPTVGNSARFKIDLPASSLNLPKDFYLEGNVVTNIKNCPLNCQGTPFDVVRVELLESPPTKNRVTPTFTTVRAIQHNRPIGLRKNLAALPQKSC